MKRSCGSASAVASTSITTQITLFVCVYASSCRASSRATSFGYALSAGAGIDKNGNRNGSVVKFHIFFWLETPVMPEVVKAWMGAQNRLNAARGFGKLHKNGQTAAGLDLALYQAVQPHFIGVRFEGGDDPLASQRWGFVPGDTRELFARNGDGTKSGGA